MIPTVAGAAVLIGLSRVGANAAIRHALIRFLHAALVGDNPTKAVPPAVPSSPVSNP